MVGENWPTLFDVIITNARKPKFFYQYSRFAHISKNVLILSHEHFLNRPFRYYDHDSKTKSWSKVNKLEKGKFYQEVNSIICYFNHSFNIL